MTLNSPLAVELLYRLASHEALASTLTWGQLRGCTAISKKLWPEIMLGRRDTESPPENLPAKIRDFLGCALDLEQTLVQQTWTVLANSIQGFTLDQSLLDDDLFRMYGVQQELGAEMIFPPYTHCTETTCRATFLTDPARVEARLFTLHRGVLPVFSVSTYCRTCLTRYYLNYKIRGASSRESVHEFYPGVPEILHIQEHSFVERKLCQFFETQMAVAHTSSENIARIYNSTMAGSSTPVPNLSRLGQELDGPLVLDAFFTHGLLRHHATYHTCLFLPHYGSQRNRLNQALEARNLKHWPHACTKCMRIVDGPNGMGKYQISAIVMDGVTVGHVTCSVYNCKIRLESTQDRFCPFHSGRKLICCIIDCMDKADTGHITCAIPTHRYWEKVQKKRRTAMFQLKKRLNRAGVLNGDEADARDELQVPPTVKGRMSRSWTHNEQLLVRCCGIILSRATFYGSEGVSGGVAFMKATFPPQFPGSLPSFCFYDSNCLLLKHLRATNDTYFDSVGLPVDVFHAANKHDDLFCTMNNSPALFPELMDSDGKWVFNSSAAEQANVWFGGFQSIVREMTVQSVYNFFLDEMIAIHNSFTHEKLLRENCVPHLKPEAALR
ncbi:hypothetical protein R3P38DRAFT_2575937 [Favolaschia claudopus]|uniref:CxC5 like cysteine cluster associated with KDZ domain-containing protein n=1 Tax=Favolaschia claudopus TaxID=2862362 RepID=A0AAV9ZJX5_9AGAR